MYRYCDFCGNKISKYDRRCGCCGARIELNNEDLSLNNKNLSIETKTINQKHIANMYEDKPSKILNFLAWLFPGVVLIIGIAQLRIFPKRSKSMIKWAIIAYCFHIVWVWFISPNLLEFFFNELPPEPLPEDLPSYGTEM